MKLMWNNRLTSTAALCKYKMDGDRPIAEIHISNKVCDTPCKKKKFKLIMLLRLSFDALLA
jgi:hypothetical protein